MLLQCPGNFLEVSFELRDLVGELLLLCLGIFLVGPLLPFVLGLPLLSLLLLAELFHRLDMLDGKVEVLLLEGVGDHLDHAQEHFLVVGVIKTP